MTSANSLEVKPWGVGTLGQLTASEPFPGSLILKEMGTELGRKGEVSWRLRYRLVGVVCPWISWLMAASCPRLLCGPLGKGLGQSMEQEPQPLLSPQPLPAPLSGSWMKKGVREGEAPRVLSLPLSALRIHPGNAGTVPEGETLAAETMFKLKIQF